MAHIADTPDVPLGNVYYYFKTKDDIIGAVVEKHVEQVKADVAALEKRHCSPRARLKALVKAVPVERRKMVAQYGCPFGTVDRTRATSRSNSSPPPGHHCARQSTWAIGPRRPPGPAPRRWIEKLTTGKGCQS